MWTQTIEKKSEHHLPEEMLAAALRGFIDQGCQAQDAGELAALAVVVCLDRYYALTEVDDDDEEEET